MKHRFLLTSVAALVTLLASPAWAVITYDFRGDPNPLGLAVGNIGDSVTVSQNGLSMTISGFNGGSAQDMDRIAGFGLGVAGGPNSNSLGSGEAIEFSFLDSVMAIETLLLAGC